MSKQAAREFFEKLNTTESMQEELLATRDLDFPVVASRHGFDCDAKLLRAVAADVYEGKTFHWLGRTVAWRPDFGDGMLTVVPDAVSDDLRLTENELDLVSAGSSVKVCEEPFCNTNSGTPYKN
ncbi:MAG: hypothetical protein AAF533_26330 [Acidobacteriota bacterium]